MMKAQSNWRKRTILFFVSQCITLFGSQIVQMAIVWYVTLQTNSGAWVAAFSVCSYLPQFFVSFIGGVWADRYNRKYLIIGADALIAAVTLAMMLIMPYITAAPVLLTALLLMSIIRSAGAGVQNPAVNAVIPQLVPEEHLMRYNGINATMQSVVQFGAPAAAAVVLTMSTLRTTLLIDILTAVIGIGVFSCILLPKQEKSQEMTSVLADIGIGLRYAYSCITVRKTLIVYSLFVFFTVPAGYLSGLLVTRVFGDTYWYLTAVELVGFGGMMLGGLLMSFWGGFKSHSLTLTAGLGHVWCNGNQYGCQPPFFIVSYFNGTVWSSIDYRTNYHYDHATGKCRTFHAGACVWPYEFTLFQLLSHRHDSVRATG